MQLVKNYRLVSPDQSLSGWTARLAPLIQLAAKGISGRRGVTSARDTSLSIAVATPMANILNPRSGHRKGIPTWGIIADLLWEGTSSAHHCLHPPAIVGK